MPFSAAFEAMFSLFLPSADANDVLNQISMAAISRLKPPSDPKMASIHFIKALRGHSAGITCSSVIHLWTLQDTPQNSYNRKLVPERLFAEPFKTVTPPLRLNTP